MFRKSGKKLPEYLRELRKEWVKEGETFRLMFQDESRFGMISEHRRWRPAPERPVCPSVVSQEYTYAYGVVSLPDGQFESLDVLEDHLINELYKLENSLEITRSIVSWPWIINALMI